MKTLYIPKGESRTYETLAIDRIVVHGSLDVSTGLKAKRVTGHGYPFSKVAGLLGRWKRTGNPDSFFIATKLCQVSYETA